MSDVVFVVMFRAVYIDISHDSDTYSHTLVGISVPPILETLYTTIGCHVFHEHVVCAMSGPSLHQVEVGLTPTFKGPCQTCQLNRCSSSILSGEPLSPRVETTITPNCQLKQRLISHPVLRITPNLEVFCYILLSIAHLTAIL